MLEIEPPCDKIEPVDSIPEAKNSKEPGQGGLSHEELIINRIKKADWSAAVQDLDLEDNTN